MADTGKPESVVKKPKKPSAKSLLADLRLTGREDYQTEMVLKGNHLFKKSGALTLRQILPLFLQIKGKPYQITDHFPFEPFFHTHTPQNSVIKAGRQLSKSTSLAARGIIMSNCIPYFSTLYVTPLYEMIRRFSTNYIRPFIETSPLKRLMVGEGCVNSVLQRSFKNRSQMFFSFAFLDAERTRGIPAEQLVIDEVQMMDINLIPIIQETLSASSYSITQAAGTPLTLSSAIEGLWMRSSQAEWVMPCVRCHYDNVPALSHDLDKMIGPPDPNIAEERPGTICAKCRRPINPRCGRWIHNYPNLQYTNVGWHIPQIIMPMHYAKPDKWRVLYGKRLGLGNTPLNVFYNEVCGESFDTGAGLITLTDIKRACVLGHDNVLERAVTKCGEYIRRVLAIDWGGGGQDWVSFTSMAVLGYMPDGKIDVLFGYRSLSPHDHLGEAAVALHLAAKFRCELIAHDYGGAGSVREAFIVQSGFPVNRVVPIQYGPSGRRGIMVFKEATQLHPRHYYIVDKPRALQLVCQQIKLGGIRFFNYDFKGSDDAGLLHDFLALVEQKTETPLGYDIYSVIRNPQFPDDFAQAVNMGACTLWYTAQRWPDLSAVAKLELPQELIEMFSPTNPDWDPS